ncbi:CRISPR type III-associated RAMP protein Csm3 [Fervidicola ferrireducens]|uniref:CRISPR system Cms endoribonuclease Csm3 n=1 Tax=Fervidicola ferrireducens TaxID=520764 RepID=A0A140L874_9FIRM|nr:type III-A CRISPR-associated RAMP protein Csm3 [Fervidicola ferrireducens]KXG76749.1 CRISPR type III-associated RAMP protein Csm3 [Fervidicola ferrireducens]
MKNFSYVLKGKYIIKFDIIAKTGLHIGASNNSLDIGGVDNAVIKDEEGKPYIPGSSLKGKMRSLMEYAEGLIKPEELIFSKESKDDPIRIHMCDKEDCAVCNIFGRNHGKHKFVSGKEVVFENITPTRLIVRDAKLDKESITKEMKENIDFEWTEVKFENNLDRITSSANPRQTERVPAGAKFKGEMVLNVLNDEGTKYLSKVIQAMKLLEDDYLGGQGSRGYGKIKFENIKITFRDKEYYEEGRGEKVIVENAKDLSEIKL